MFRISIHILRKKIWESCVCASRYESSDGAESDASVQTVKSGAGAGEAEESASRRESAASISMCLSQKNLGGRKRVSHENVAPSFPTIQVRPAVCRLAPAVPAPLPSALPRPTRTVAARPATPTSWWSARTGTSSTPITSSARCPSASSRSDTMTPSSKLCQICGFIYCDRFVAIGLC